MHKLKQLNQAALLSACVAGPIALVSSGEYGRAAAPEAPGYAALEFMVRGEIRPASTTSFVAASIPARRQ